MAVASRFCTLGFGARNNSRRTRRRCVRLCTRDGTPCPGLLRRAGLWRKMRRSLPPLCKSLLGKMVRRTGQTFWTPSFPKGLPRRRRFRERSRSSCRSSPPSQRHEQEPLCAQDAQEATVTFRSMVVPSLWTSRGRSSQNRWAKLTSLRTGTGFGFFFAVGRPTCFKNPGKAVSTSTSALKPWNHLIAVRLGACDAKGRRPAIVITSSFEVWIGNPSGTEGMNVEAQELFGFGVGDYEEREVRRLLSPLYCAFIPSIFG